MTVPEAKQKAEELRSLINSGQIDYTEGRRQLEEVFLVLNAEGEKIAKKYGRKHRPFSINAFLR